MIYLDNSATSFPKAPGTADTVKKFLTESGVNASRASYKSSTMASMLLYNTRKALKKLFKAQKTENIIFTSGTTHSLNMVIQSYVIKAHKQAKKAHFLTSSMEHNAVMRPLKHWADLGMCSYETCPCLTSGLLDMVALKKILNDQSVNCSTSFDLMIFTACSNVTGTIFPVKKICEIAHEYNIPCCVDAAQAAGKCLGPVNEIKADYICFSGHKGLLGPFGIGGLILNPSCKAAFDPLIPLITGGTGSASDSIEQPDFLPDSLEAGTLNLSGIAGLNTSVNWLLEKNNKTGDSIVEHEKKLSCYLLDLLTKEGLIKEGLITSEKDCINNKGLISIHSPVNMPEIWDGTLSLSFKNKTPSEAVNYFDNSDIAVRMGLHCAPMAHKTVKTFNQGGTIRISPGPFNTTEDMKTAYECIRRICD